MQHDNSLSYLCFLLFNCALIRSWRASLQARSVLFSEGLAEKHFLGLPVIVNFPTIDSHAFSARTKLHEPTSCPDLPNLQSGHTLSSG